MQVYTNKKTSKSYLARLDNLIPTSSTIIVLNKFEYNTSTELNRKKETNMEKIKITREQLDKLLWAIMQTKIDFMFLDNTIGDLPWSETILESFTTLRTSIGFSLLPFYQVLGHEEFKKILTKYYDDMKLNEFENYYAENEGDSKLKYDVNFMIENKEDIIDNDLEWLETQASRDIHQDTLFELID